NGRHCLELKPVMMKLVSNTSLSVRHNRSKHRTQYRNAGTLPTRLLNTKKLYVYHASLSHIQHRQTPHTTKNNKYSNHRTYR
ncbi:unnamed protein product, partial [Ectocarpus sp. 6 AP-2014]